jgi:uncharacterized ferritin-like protein (DUF455 family)
MSALLNPLLISDARLKLYYWGEACWAALISPNAFQVPSVPDRDITITNPTFHPPKVGFSHKEGRARAIHDLANIELQAMELALRTLIEYPEAPKQFRTELYELALSEGRHFEMCINALDELGMPWGTWPGHLCLWEAVLPTDSLIERIVLVHRFLEGSGLDAGATLLKRLDGVVDPLVKGVVKTISTEELDHVQFGSRWFHKICEERKLNSTSEFKRCFQAFLPRIPKRVEPINVDLRRRALFTEAEIEVTRQLREYFLLPKEERDRTSF